MQIELMDCTRVLLDEIADKRFKRKTVALTYAMAICSSDETDWKRVNTAIFTRWSMSGLDYIKTLAWKMVEEKAKCNKALEEVDGKEATDA